MTNSKTTFEIENTENYKTVNSIDEYGEKWDINHSGAEINNEDELIEFINELHDQKFFDAETRDDLIDQI